MPAQSLTAKSAFKTDDVVMLYRPLYRYCRHARQLRLDWYREIANRLIDRYNQSRKLIG